MPQCEPVWTSVFPLTVLIGVAPQLHSSAIILTSHLPTSPELLSGEPRTLSHGLELGPDHSWMDLRGQGGLRREPAVTPGDDVLAPHQPGVVHESLGDEIRVLDDVTGVTDHAWNEHLAVRELDVFPHVPFVRVARVRRLKRIGASVDTQY